MRHIDLFSGVGGFALAAREVWGDDHEIVTFCEINKYAQQVLKKHWPGVPCCEDIRRLNGQFVADSKRKRLQELKQQNDATDTKKTSSGLDDRLERYNSTNGGRDEFIANAKRLRLLQREHGGRTRSEEGVLEGHRGAHQIDLLTGGFPCQPFSNAGRKGGKNDDRFLWPEMLRVIKEFKPRWIVGENVGGLINMAQPDGESEVGGETDTEIGEYDQSEAGGLLFGIIDSIEQAGYTVQAFVIPACAVGAPHRRDRIWIVAHTRCGDGQRASERGELERPVSGTQDAAKSERPVGLEGDELIGNTTSDGRNERECDRQGRQVRNSAIGQDEEGKQERDRRECGIGEGSCITANTSNTGLQGCERDGAYDYKGQATHGSVAECRDAWDRNWVEVALATCDVRMDDGLPVELDGLKLSKSQHRVERLKGLGNAIVPQVVMEIFKCIKQIDAP